MTPENKTLFRTGLTSYVHSIVSGALALYAIVSTNLPVHMGEAVGPLMLTLCSLSCGYFVMDLTVMLYERTWLEVRFYVIHWHHVVCIVALGLQLLFRPDVAAHLTLQLFCEVNNWFLHGSKLLRKVGMPTTSPLFALMDAGFYVTYFTTRLPPHLFVGYELVVAPTLPVLWQWCAGAACCICIIGIDLLMIVDFVGSRRHMARKKLRQDAADAALDKPQPSKGE